MQDENPVVVKKSIRVKCAKTFQKKSGFFSGTTFDDTVVMTTLIIMGVQKPAGAVFRKLR